MTFIRRRALSFVSLDSPVASSPPSFIRWRFERGGEHATTFSLLLLRRYSTSLTPLGFLPLSACICARGPFADHSSGAYPLNSTHSLKREWRWRRRETISPARPLPQEAEPTFLPGVLGNMWTETLLVTHHIVHMG